MTTKQTYPAAAAATREVEGHWREELERYLRPTHFPARLDQLLSTLARHRAPSHLYWRLASLPLSRTYAGLDELTAALEAQTATRPVPEPI